MSALPNPSFDSPHGIQRLLPRHFRILEMVLAGHDNTTISKTLGISTRSITMLKQSPLFQTELVRRRENSKEETMLTLDREAIMGKARSILENASLEAAETVEGLMYSDDDSIKFRAAESILDRVFGKKGEASNSGVVVNISAEHVQLLNLALKETVHASIQPADCKPTDDPEGRRDEGVCKQVPVK